ncbi:MAG TPA: hypothetical protein VF696_00975 [Candidatus Paceibacterota bacterium]
MRRIVLLSCVSKKLDCSAPARELYISPLFRFGLAYAESLKPDAIYILSAKHGLVGLDKVLDPYEETLNTKRDAEIREWSVRVLQDLRQVADMENDEFVFLAGDRYRRHLLPHLRHARMPLQGLGLGRQLQFLKRHI